MCLLCRSRRSAAFTLPSSCSTLPTWERSSDELAVVFVSTINTPTAIHHWPPLPSPRLGSWVTRKSCRSHLSRGLSFVTWHGTYSAGFWSPLSVSPRRGGLDLGIPSIWLLMAHWGFDSSPIVYCLQRVHFFLSFFFLKLLKTLLFLITCLTTSPFIMNQVQWIYLPIFLSFFLSNFLKIFLFGKNFNLQKTRKNKNSADNTHIPVPKLL